MRRLWRFVTWSWKAAHFVTTTLPWALGAYRAYRTFRTGKVHYSVFD